MIANAVRWPRLFGFCPRCLEPYTQRRRVKPSSPISKWVGVIRIELAARRAKHGIVPILSARDLVKAYGPSPLLAGVSLTIESGERVGLLGANGAGKSTLLRVLAKVEPADEGVIDRRRGASILYLPQEPKLPEDASPRQIVEQALSEWHAALARHAEAPPPSRRQVND